jgi:hypothetical protein
MGMTFKIFQDFENIDGVRIVLLMWVLQGRINGRMSLINLIGIPSRPVATDLTRDMAFKTLRSSTFRKLKCPVVGLEV